MTYNVCFLNIYLELFNYETCKILGLVIAAVDLGFGIQNRLYCHVVPMYTHTYIDLCQKR